MNGGGDCSRVEGKLECRNNPNPRCEMGGSAQNNLGPRVHAARQLSVDDVPSTPVRDAIGRCPPKDKKMV